MYEIELKAHVDPDAVDGTRALLDSFATFKKEVDKCDDYYHLDNNGHAVTVRFRRERSKGVVTNIFTYKKKEVQNNTEVNDERECTLSEASPILEALLDAGFVHSLHKHKSGALYTFETPLGVANIDLCLVETLGYFIEIEILSDKNDDETVAATQKQLHTILSLCKISKSAIECRYYKELLNEKGSSKTQ